MTKTSKKPNPPFERNPEHNEAEFNKQLKDQEDAINDMTTKDWLENREEFRNRNKADYNKKAKRARDEFRKEEIDRRTLEHIRNGMDPELAKQEAIKSMKGKAALHNPDGVAGGKVDDITAMGDSNVNSSLGSQWKNRGNSIEDQIKIDHGIPPKTIDDIPSGEKMDVDLF